MKCLEIIIKTKNSIFIFTENNDKLGNLHFICKVLQELSIIVFFQTCDQFLGKLMIIVHSNQFVVYRRIDKKVGLFNFADIHQHLALGKIWMGFFEFPCFRAKVSFKVINFNGLIFVRAGTLYFEHSPFTIMKLY